MLYAVPEFAPRNYQVLYPNQSATSDPDFASFFERYERFDPTSEEYDILPDTMGELDKAMCSEIAHDEENPELRANAFVNLRHIPNGHYTVFYLRIGQPMADTSRLKVLGKSPNIFVNIDRSLIVQPGAAVLAEERSDNGP